MNSSQIICAAAALFGVFLIFKENKTKEKKNNETSQPTDIKEKVESQEEKKENS